MTNGHRLNRDKLKKLVHYVCYRCRDPKDLGKTKLNKVLWFADTVHYAQTGEPIAGETYIKRQYGPVSKNFLQVIEELEGEGALVERTDPDYYGYAKKEYIALTKPDLAAFSSVEINVIEEIIDYVCYQHTAVGISERTHDDIWDMAEIGEELPYDTVFASQLLEITEDDVAWAKEELAGSTAT